MVLQLSIMLSVQKSLTSLSRVEKYRPDTLDDVSGHKDIIATINKFIEANVKPKRPIENSKEPNLCPSASHISFSTARLVQEKPPQSLP